MCGIAGIYQLDKTALDVRCLQLAAHHMRHRGPDGEGYLLLNTASGEHSLRSGPETPANVANSVPLESEIGFAPNLGFAHRRLAILDLSPKGHEPITVPGEQYWLTFNGEIYNYVELRDELRARGYEFHTECDAEVLIQAYDAWGIDCLQRFIGMFAFALWDQKRRRLWCVRDRMGVKPFYYVNTPSLFAFASEVKALKVIAPEECCPAMPQLFSFLQYGSVYHAPDTFFEGVRELPGSHYLLIENGVVSEPIRWWDVDLGRTPYDYADPEGEFRRLLQDSVRLRLRSDVPVGTCLSGGLDSSAIVALATGQLDGGRMNSFSVVYPVRGLDESRYINLVAHRFNTIRHEITPTPDHYLETADKITWHQDIPTATPTVYSQYFVMRAAQGNVTVLLDGQGGDELMAGYLSHVVFYLNHLRKHQPGRWLREQTAFSLGVWSHFNAALNWREFGFRAAEYLTHRSSELLTHESRSIAMQHSSIREKRTLHGSDALNNHLYQALFSESIPSLLHYEDRNSMAYGIEARVPFLDHRLIEFSLGIPTHLKIRGVETKRLMRRALRGVLPDEVIDRKDKLGFPTPFSQWLRGPLRSEVNTFLNDAVLKREWYNADQVRRIWQMHQNGSADMSRLIHRLISAEQWYAQHCS